VAVPSQSQRTARSWVERAGQPVGDRSVPIDAKRDAVGVPGHRAEVGDRAVRCPSDRVDARGAGLRDRLVADDRAAVVDAFGLAVGGTGQGGQRGDGAVGIPPHRLEMRHAGVHSARDHAAVVDRGRAAVGIAGQAAEPAGGTGRTPPGGQPEALNGERFAHGHAVVVDRIGRAARIAGQCGQRGDGTGRAPANGRLLAADRVADGRPRTPPSAAIQLKPYPRKARRRPRSIRVQMLAIVLVPSSVLFAIGVAAAGLPVPDRNHRREVRIDTDGNGPTGIWFRHQHRGRTSAEPVETTTDHTQPTRVQVGGVQPVQFGALYDDGRYFMQVLGEVVGVDDCLGMAPMRTSPTPIPARYAFHGWRYQSRSRRLCSVSRTTTHLGRVKPHRWWRSFDHRRHDDSRTNVD